ncbi:Methyltransferase type 11 protein [Actinidia chinensis var. chinensis]|uniref:Methyltransferase type 11 protein n=1 Tax=Actinidia chinensis var. chinensis TaxID=1590841 RepID=A0A2R6RNN8_ACTCC|nr:Methyltransferase type 11 protein [Actinidia chinensis var. chinensis]
MAMVTLSSFSASVVLTRGGQTGKSSRSFFFKPLLIFSSRFVTLKSTFATKMLASSTAFVKTKPDSISDAKEASTSKIILACPICYDQLISKGDPILSVDSAPRSSLQCSTCMKAYLGNDTHIDLTVASGAKEYGEAMPASTELFRSPLISFLYERGWRQSFSIWGGFPGPEKEFELIKEYLKPVLGGNIVDASCGSGLFSRLFAKSGLFSLVVALDFSENMLRQCYEFIKQEKSFPKENLILVRADIARLPFPSRSVDAVHAGAALHCWPSPSAAVAEISRVLRPGGFFVATTYIVDGPYAALPLLGPLRQSIGQISGSHIFLAERELEDLCNACGLVGFTSKRNRRFVMISATKPS